MERLKAELAEATVEKDNFSHSCDHYAQRIRELETQATALTPVQR